jgi:hypothetical protein
MRIERWGAAIATQRLGNCRLTGSRWRVILKTACDAYPFAMLDAAALIRSYGKKDFVCPYRETDYNFIVRLTLVWHSPMARNASGSGIWAVRFSPAVWRSPTMISRSPESISSALPTRSSSMT